MSVPSFLLQSFIWSKIIPFLSFIISSIPLSPIICPLFVVSVVLITSIPRSLILVITSSSYFFPFSFADICLIDFLIFLFFFFFFVFVFFFFYFFFYYFLFFFFFLFIF